MSLATIFLTQNARKDDIIRISRDEEFGSMYMIEYQAHDVAKKHVFYFGITDTMNYLSDIFKSLDRDTEPFENLQVSTAIHPSIMYSVADMGCQCVRRQVEDMINMALRADVQRVKRDTA